MPHSSCRILIANGVNLDLLGQREPELYGSRNLAALETYLRSFIPQFSAMLGLSLSLEFYQSNHEGLFLDQLGQGWDGIILNPGAWTHTSLALADRLAALRVPFIEVHLSQLAQRERLRQRSFCAPHALGVIWGLGFNSYLSGLLALSQHLANRS